MPDMENALVNPYTGPGTPSLGPVALLVATRTDLNHLYQKLPLADALQRPLLQSELFYNLPDIPHLSICGPVLGAPYSVMVLETLIAWGVKTALFAGWCGSITETARIGDIILPQAAISDEGTSRHYRPEPFQADAVSYPCPMVLQGLRHTLQDRQVTHHSGRIWTTDAIYRETPSRIRHYQLLGALAVEMELSALQTVAAFRHIHLAGLLVVSDELFTMTWQPGFKRPTFKDGCQHICDALVSYAIQGYRENRFDSLPATTTTMPCRGTTPC